ncbi:MAG: DUF4416 family protein [Spirochaetales bacterium]|nr:DUF4416 family protein [Spirochaetales bacterium]
MGQARPFEAEKLVVAVLASRRVLARPGWWEQLRELLEQRFGPIDYSSRELPFGFTRYYDAELGAPLARRFVAFRTLVDPQALARIKITTNALEDELRGHEAGPRTVNLDPGLLSLSRLVLASTKDSSHRIPLAEGIFGEITLQYRRPAFRPVPWTYPDYRSEEVRGVLLEIRGLFKSQRQARPSTRTPSRGPEPPAPIGPPPR